MTARSPLLKPLEKMSFSRVRDEGFLKALEASGCRQVVPCGIESHV